MTLKTFSNLAITNSSGRLYKQQIQHDFLEDRFRIVNSKAFRRLECKTQVFINRTGDHYRTRLTHSLEVSQIAIHIAKILGLNTELAEIISLSHDIGHPPFGHAGEKCLDTIVTKYGGFDHNIHTIKTIAMIEKYSTEFKGLNLTIEAIDGVLKRNGKITDKKKINQLNKILHYYPISYNRGPLLESQIASISDDIGYTKHDLDDGIRAKFINFRELENLNIFQKIKYNNIKNSVFDEKIKVNSFLVNLNNFLVCDLIAQTTKNINSNNIENIEDIYLYDKLLVEFSKDVQNDFLELKQFLFKNVYKNYFIRKTIHKTNIIIESLYNHFIENPTKLPTSWHDTNIFNCKKLLSEQVVNYIAGMTDRYAIKQYQKLLHLPSDYSFLQNL